MQALHPGSSRLLNQRRRSCNNQPQCRRLAIAKAESGGHGNGLFSFMQQGFSMRQSSPSNGGPPSNANSSPQLGKRMLNVGPNAAPSQIAAALAASFESGDKSGRPLHALHALPSDASSTTSSGGHGNGTGISSSNGNGIRGAPGQMISMSELDSMLHGLRSSLASIQQSRAQYVHLLSEREETITKLQSQLTEKEQRAQELADTERQLQAFQGSDSTAAAELEASAAEAEARAAEMANRAAEAEARAAEIEAWAAEVEARAAKAEARAATAEAKALVTQELLQARAQELEEAKAVAERVAEAQAAAQQQAQQAATPKRPPTPPPRPVAEVVISYKTGWKQAFVHCNMDGKGWTTSPGLPMDSVSDTWKMIRLPCSQVEFVINNGKNDWDSIPGNYHVRNQGSYKLENGQLQRTQ